MINLEDIITRLKFSLEKENNSDIAKLVGLHPANFSQRKKRGSLFEPLIRLAVNEKLNIEWLLTGEGAMRLEEKTAAVPVSQEQSPNANGRYEDVYNDVREILASGDDFIIRAFRERLKDYKLSMRMSRERRDLQQRLATVEKELKELKGGGGSPGEGTPGGGSPGASTDAGAAPGITEGESDIGKKAM